MPQQQSEKSAFWAGNTSGKLFIQSGHYTSVIKDSLDVSAIDLNLGGISFDGQNTPWNGFSGDKNYLQSGQFASVLKTSLDVSGVNLTPLGISSTRAPGADTPWCGLTSEKLYWSSGQFTSTIKTSQAQVAQLPSGISYDNQHTYWVGDGGNTIARNFGQLGPLISFVIITAVESGPQSCSLDYFDTLLVGSVGDKLYMLRGKTSTVLLASLDISGSDSVPTGIENGSINRRLILPTVAKPRFFQDHRRIRRGIRAPSEPIERVMRSLRGAGPSPS